MCAWCDSSQRVQLPSHKLIDVKVGHSQLFTMRDGSRLYAAVERTGEFGLTPRALRFYKSRSLLTRWRAPRLRLSGLGLGLGSCASESGSRGKDLAFSLAGSRDCLRVCDIEFSQSDQFQHLEQRVSVQITEPEQQQIARERTLVKLDDIGNQTRAAISQNVARPRGPSATSPQSSLLTIGDDA